MMDNLAQNITKAGRDFLTALDVFTDEDFNTQPFEGSWTPGEVAEHVLKQVQGTLHNVTGPTIESNRPADASVAMFRKIFLDFTIKMTSPDFILPSSGQKNKTVLVNLLKKSFDDLAAFAASGADLTVLCANFEMPTVGKLSRLEWLAFADVHTQRHTHQLKEIALVIAV